MKLCDRPRAREVQSPGSHPQSAKQTKTKNSTQNPWSYTSFTEVAFCCSCTGGSCLGRTTYPQYLYYRPTCVTRQRTSLSGHSSSTSDPPQEGRLPAKPVRNLVSDPLQNYVKPRASPTECSFPCRHADAMHPPLGVMSCVQLLFRTPETTEIAPLLSTHLLGHLVEKFAVSLPPRRHQSQ